MVLGGLHIKYTWLLINGYNKKSTMIPTLPKIFNKNLKMASIHLDKPMLVSI